MPYVKEELMLRFIKSVKIFDLIEKNEYFCTQKMAP